MISNPLSSLSLSLNGIYEFLLRGIQFSGTREAQTFRPKRSYGMGLSVRPSVCHASTAALGKQNVKTK